MNIEFKEIEFELIKNIFKHPNFRKFNDNLVLRSPFWFSDKTKNELDEIIHLYNFSDLLEYDETFDTDDVNNNKNCFIMFVGKNPVCKIYLFELKELLQID